MVVAIAFVSIDDTTRPGVYSAPAGVM